MKEKYDRSHEATLSRRRLKPLFFCTNTNCRKAPTDAETVPCTVRTRCQRAFLKQCTPGALHPWGTWTLGAGGALRVLTVKTSRSEVRFDWKFGTMWEVCVTVSGGRAGGCARDLGPWVCTGKMDILDIAEDGVCPGHPLFAEDIP